MDLRPGFALSGGCSARCMHKAKPGQRTGLFATPPIRLFDFPAPPLLLELAEKVFTRRTQVPDGMADSTLRETFRH